MDHSSQTAPALFWGVRTSFLTYVAGVGGVIDVGEPASDEGGTFSFVFDQSRSSQEVAAYRGSVRFHAHDGLLDVSIIDPWIEMDSSGWVLSAVGSSTGERRAIVALSAGKLIEEAGPTTKWDCSAVLAEDGVQTFGFNYPAGTEMAPLRFSIPRT